jgi:hypothetical protein
MNRLQSISQAIETERLKLQMGLNPSVDIHPLTLRAMWIRLYRENKREPGRRDNDLHES